MKIFPALSWTAPIGLERPAVIRGTAVLKGGSTASLNRTWSGFCPTKRRLPPLFEKKIAAPPVELVLVAGRTVSAVAEPINSPRGTF